MSATFVKAGDATFTTSGSWTTGTGAGIGYPGTGASTTPFSFIAAGTGGFCTFQFTGLTAGQYYRLADFIYYGGVNNGSSIAWQILDSDATTVLASGTFNGATGAASWAGKFVSDVGLAWIVLSDGVCPSGTSLNVRIFQNAANFTTVNATRLDTGVAGTLAATSQSTSSISLSFTASSTLVGTPTGTPYQLQRAADSNGSPGAFSNVGSAQSGTTFTDSAVSANASYWYRVVVSYTNSNTANSAATLCASAAAPTGEVMVRGTAYSYATPFQSNSLTYGPENLTTGSFANGFAANSAGTVTVLMDLGASATLTGVRFTPSQGDEDQPAAGTFGVASSQNGSYSTIKTVPAGNYPSITQANPGYVNNEFAVTGTGQFVNLNWTTSSEFNAMTELEVACNYTGGLSQAYAFTPTVTLTPGAVAGTATATIASRTTNGTSWYTNDGTTPSVIDGVAQGTTTKYTGQFTGTAGQVIQAITTHPALTPSPVSPAYTIQSGIPFESNSYTDNGGQPLQSHHGDTIYSGGYYWRFGGDMRNGSTAQNNAPGILCYRSSDQMNWTFMGVAITTASIHALDSNVGWIGSATLEYNASTNKLVMWFNSAANGGGAGDTYQRACNTTAAPTTDGTSPTWATPTTGIQPNANISGDLSFLIDSSGNGWLAYSVINAGSGAPTSINITALNAACTAISGSATVISSAAHEAPTLFQASDNTYHCWVSAVAGWAGSVTTDFTASTATGTWTSRGNPFQTSGSADNTISYNSQTRCVFKTQVGQYIYHGDSWNGTELYQSTFCVLPVTVSSTISSISYAASFTPTQAGLSATYSNGILTLTGSNGTLWTSPPLVPSSGNGGTLFTVSGGTLGAPSVNNNTSASASFTATPGTYTVRDMSTGATANFTISAPSGGMNIPLLESCLD